MLIILIVLILVFGFGGYRLGPGIGYYGGCGISLILLIIVFCLHELLYLLTQVILLLCCHCDPRTLSCACSFMRPC